MSEKKLKRQILKKKLFTKNRLIILNEDSFEEIFSLKLTLMNVFVVDKSPCPSLCNSGELLLPYIDVWNPDAPDGIEHISVSADEVPELFGIVMGNTKPDESRLPPNKLLQFPVSSFPGYGGNDPPSPNALTGAYGF